VTARAAPDLPSSALAALRAGMSRDAGVVRDGAGLAGLVTWIGALQAAHGRALPLIAARLVAEAALARRESRGGHFRADFPVAVSPTRSRLRLSPDADRRDRAA